MSPTIRLLPILLAIGLTACGDLKETPTEPGGGGDVDPTATFTRVETEVFAQSCALGGCHDATTHQMSLNLTAGNAYSMIVSHPSVENSGLLRVRPLDPENSYLYLKVIGDPRISGSRMPRGRAPLSDAKLKLIRDWIRRGAPND